MTNPTYERANRLSAWVFTALLWWIAACAIWKNMELGWAFGKWCWGCFS